MRNSVIVSTARAYRSAFNNTQSRVAGRDVIAQLAKHPVMCSGMGSAGLFGVA
jgi:hypothetical protein